MQYSILLYSTAIQSFNIYYSSNITNSLLQFFNTVILQIWYSCFPPSDLPRPPTSCRQFFLFFLKVVHLVVVTSTVKRMRFIYPNVCLHTHAYYTRLLPQGSQFLQILKHCLCTLNMVGNGGASTPNSCFFSEGWQLFGFLVILHEFYEGKNKEISMSHNIIV